MQAVDHRTAANARALLDLARRGYASEAALVGVQLPPQRETVAQLQQDPGRFLVWRDRTGLAGLISWETEGADILISRLCVSPTLRRRGIAAALLEACLAGPGPGAAVRVTTAVANTPALVFYAARGFRPEAERVSTDGIPLVHLRRPPATET